MTRILNPTPTRGLAPSHSPPDTRYAPGVGLARGLGWFSIGLGLTELLTPRLVSRLTGVRSMDLLRAYGLREIAAGVGILNSSRPAGWMWARVAGDGLDIATLLAAALRGEGRRPLIATAAVAGVAALDTVCAAQLTAAAMLEG